MGLGGDRIVFKTTGEQSGGLLAFLEYHAQPGSIGTSLHVHDGHEEGFYVVQGVLDMQLGDEKLKAHPGAWVFVPRGAAHAFWNSGSEPCVFVGTFTPSGFENLFVERDRLLARGLTRADPELRDLGSRYGMTELGPPPGRVTDYR
jgi:mannose-6-phosphate isomerase-like protein (cupin superfamily)